MYYMILNSSAALTPAEMNAWNRWTTIEIDWDLDSAGKKALPEVLPGRIQVPSFIDINNEIDARNVFRWLSKKADCCVAGIKPVEGEARLRLWLDFKQVPDAFVVDEFVVSVLRNVLVL